MINNSKQEIYYKNDSIVLSIDKQLFENIYLQIAGNTYLNKISMQSIQ